MPSSIWSKPETSTRPIAINSPGVIVRRVAMMWAAARSDIMSREKASKTHAKKDPQASKLGTQSTPASGTTLMVNAVHSARTGIDAMPANLDMKTDIWGQVDSSQSSQRLPNTGCDYRSLDGHEYMAPEQTNYALTSCGRTGPTICPFRIETVLSASFQIVRAKEGSAGSVFHRIRAAIQCECLLVMADGVSDAKMIDDIFKSWFKAEMGPCMMMDPVWDLEVVFEQQMGLNLGERNGRRLMFVRVIWELRPV
ncbi:Dehydrogenase multihelical [Penicillium chermesinum]|uniref:Dehydrogenase multihelical n=1 Tax=Penicillium chermesinum TaxID=63820 RepID=A0A9W9P8A0_9EURO|nr:Dehydrogenase multihelical [Penicillium chermesinum]KAJ5239705.1 Dehydrogenase multihelical [Penicillium chermesinum]KAJ6166589.1 Dehydrogenase multihelical [Penicillium chermesinum]